LTTKIVALVDALGNLVKFLLLPGQAHDMKGVAPLIEGVSLDALLADKAFDTDWLLQDVDARGATAVIPPKANRKIQREYDEEIYKWRHLVENYFAKVKEFSGIATRYDKTDCSYAACWNLGKIFCVTTNHHGQQTVLGSLFHTGNGCVQKSQICRL
jgi:transposase